MNTDIEVKLYKDLCSKYWKAEYGQTLGNEYKYNPFNGMITTIIPYLYGQAHGKVYMVGEKCMCFLNYNYDKSNGIVMSDTHINGKVMKEKVLYKDEIMIKRTFYP